MISRVYRLAPVARWNYQGNGIDVELYGPSYLLDSFIKADGTPPVYSTSKIKSNDSRKRFGCTYSILDLNDKIDCWKYKQRHIKCERFDILLSKITTATRCVSRGIWNKTTAIDDCADVGRHGRGGRGWIFDYKQVINYAARPKSLYFINQIIRWDQFPFTRFSCRAAQTLDVLSSKRAWPI